ncbi:hypothetical protein JYT44_03735 [Caldithrix abyssi]|nr:hypothetical protein [Caldithrix abyssi]
MSRRLNVASALLLLVGLFFVFGGIAQMFLFAGTEFSNEDLPEATVSQIRDFTPELVDLIELAVQTRGVYLLTLALFWSVISLIPYRKGEKWAWYAMLTIGGITAFGFLILNYIGVTLGVWESSWITIGIIVFILWIVGLALPAKEILGKPSS